MLFLLALFGVPGVAWAHLLPRQTATLNVVDKAAFLVVSVPVSALKGIDDDGDGRVSPVEIARHRGAMASQFDARLHVLDNGQRGTAVLTWVLSPNSDANDPTDYVVVLHRVNFPAAPEHPELIADVFGTGADERQMTITATHGEGAAKITEVAILDAQTPGHVFFRGPLALFADFIRVGIIHILTGYDHLLFLLTIVSAVAGWRIWLGVVSSFTLAHSITLVLSALDIVRISPRVIEPGIALSIVVVALINLYAPNHTRYWPRIAIVFGCGLLHGFGFASAISALAVTGTSRIATLAGFNLGLEAGQVLFIGAFALIVLALRRAGRGSIAERLPRAASLAAAVLGMVLLMQRLILI